MSLLVPSSRIKQLHIAMSHPGFARAPIFATYCNQDAAQEFTIHDLYSNMYNTLFETKDLCLSCYNMWHLTHDYKFDMNRVRLCYFKEEIISLKETEANGL